MHMWITWNSCIHQLDFSQLQTFKSSTLLYYRMILRYLFLWQGISIRWILYLIMFSFTLSHQNCLFNNEHQNPISTCSFERHTWRPYQLGQQTSLTVNALSRSSCRGCEVSKIIIIVIRTTSYSIWAWPNVFSSRCYYLISFRLSFFFSLYAFHSSFYLCLNLYCLLFFVSTILIHYTAQCC